MGQFLILGASSINEAVNHIGEPSVDQVWEWADGGILFIDASRSNAECEALYVGFTPSGDTDLEYEVPLPAAYETHRQHVVDFRNAIRNNQSPTLAQTQHAMADLIDGIFLLVSRRMENG